jgi:hypothetical protein
VIRHSGHHANEAVDDLTGEFRDADNIAFLDAALDLVESRVGNEARGAIVLLGQRDLPGIALRRAQGMLRWDRRPSLWSHAMILTQGRDETGGDVAALRCREVTLHSRRGIFPDPEFNAVTDVTLGDYASPVVDANVAVIGIRMSAEQNQAVLDRTLPRMQKDDPHTGVNLDRARYDLWELLGLWQSYLWTRGTPNPLEQGVPMFNAAFVAYCYEAIGLDVTPGASERHAAPEHIWNGARWWRDEYRWVEGAGRSPAPHEESPVTGCYCVRDVHCGVLDPDEIAGAG